MQRILCALVAGFSLLTTTPQYCGAQNTGTPADPTAAPQQIDETVGAAASDRKLRAGQEQGGEVRIIGPHERVSDVAVADQRLILQGQVSKDVLAVNSDVLIEKGATVGGHVVLVGGHLTNMAGDSVRVVLQDKGLTGDLRRELHVGPTGMMISSWATQPAADRSEPPVERHNWLGGQFALLLLGLFGAFLMRIAAPRATDEVAETVSVQPGRCLLVGGASVIAILIVLSINAILLKANSGIGLLWKPIGFAIAIAPCIALVLGWLAGMKFAGDMIAKRLGRAEQAGLVGRIALALCVFFVVNSLLGSLSEGLGVICLGVESVFAVMGLGAALMTGFGTQPQWLVSRSGR